MSVSTTEVLIKAAKIFQNVVISIAAFLFVTIIAVLAIMSLAPDPSDNVFELLTSDVKIDDYLVIEQTTFRREVCITEPVWTMFDSSGTKVIIAIKPAPTGNIGQDMPFKRRIKITRDMNGEKISPGKARIRLSLTWQCPNNWYQKISPRVKVYDDIYFNIVE